MKTTHISDPINKLIIEVTASSIDRDHAIFLLGDTLKTVIIRHVPEDQQELAIKSINEELQKVKSGDLRVARGFFGNWAKSEMNKKSV